jgi:hypothetical protein
MNRIKINELRARGAKKDYYVTFKGALNIISGEIATGKTSILDLIDYCFGATECPEYPEISRKATTALLEIEIDREVFTIERQLFSKRQKENVHFCRIKELPLEHKMIEVSSSQKRGEESISSFILSKMGLGEIPLKEAPSQDISNVDIMSFRDVLWLCYLKRTRVAGADLLFEKTHMKENKLVQVFEVLFDLYSNRSAVLGAELQSTQEETQERQQMEKTLLRFADSQGFLPLEQLEEDKKRLLQEIASKKDRLDEIDKKISGSSELAKDLQAEVLGLRAELQKARTERRSLEKTLQRLLPLRAQYHEDISKLQFLNQAKTIFDPLSLVLCPMCLSPLAKDTGTKETCPLCGQMLQKNGSDVSVDVSREIRTIERKLNELIAYVGDLEERIKQNAKQDKQVSEKLAIASQKLDDTLKSFVSPYLSEREELVSSISVNQNEIQHKDELVKVRKDIQEVTEAIIRLQVRQKEIERNIAEERGKAINRTELISSLSTTFFNQLQKVKFPKLTEAQIDEKLVPYVRGLRYNLLSSEGAINLSSICWFTSIFAEAIRRSMHHPGFLILDGVQSGIGLGPRVDKEFQDESIVEGLYSLLKEVSELDDECQLIVVDNHPPEYMKKYVSVYYSRNPLKPPYGFIDDETS